MISWRLFYFRAFLASCGFATALAGCGAYAAEVIGSNDPGGLLAAYVERYRAMAARGDTFVVDGVCNAACTLALGIVDVCATPRASFGFRMARSATLFGYRPNYSWSHYMLDHYPPEIRAWIVSKGGLTPDLKFLRGEELAALVPTCPSEPSVTEKTRYNSQAVQNRPLPPLDNVHSDARPRYSGSQSAPMAQAAALGEPTGAPAAVLNEQDTTRLPPPIVPSQGDAIATGAIGRSSYHMAALPPEVRPETSLNEELPPPLRRTLVDYFTKEPAGTIIVDTPNTYLYLVLGYGKALRYGVGVGREGFTWSGVQQVTKMAEWPDWHPPEEMIVRQPYLPRFMAGGESNPLGARALYLGNSVYRIHGTNQPSTIGTSVSSGCIRLTNKDIMDLYRRVHVGTRVVVLPGHPPATASATSFAPPPAPPGVTTEIRSRPDSQDEAELAHRV